MQISKRDFKKWLESKGALQRVGVPAESMCCPIAVYLNEKYDTRANVGRIHAELFEKGHDIKVKESTRMPHWASRFIQAVDDLADKKKYITAQKALQILKEV